MTTPDLSYPRCGGLIPADAPAGQCPRCLMRAVAAPNEPTLGSNDWPTLDEALAAVPEFEIAHETGRDGMAVENRKCARS